MKCAGKHCKKDLLGGFKQKDGSFLCAVCTIHSVDMNSIKKSLLTSLEMLDLLLEPNVRATKEQLKEIKNLLKATVIVHEMDKNE